MRIVRAVTRREPVFIAGKLGIHASPVGRALHRYQTLLLRELDAVTGAVIGATRRPANRYEHTHPGSLIHTDVKKLGRIPDGGGWRVEPTPTGAVHRTSQHRVGYDYIHAVINDHPRMAYAEMHDDEKGDTCA